ncbi:helix-turn-helix domain-containing protein [Streptomyces scopuliridis]|uniref:Helix-turn-helix domain-containing protein n=1 Tax=Streptomyces scopuliridis TaxID=452529 RepID=A0ACD4ZKK8_9ACTN|nr:helix-turn-helix transcriptional regulator [Streptomyces scopuliridis]WSB98523.1 helix-turn-helix domain-containing protein [Streptomyces scopuliridis]WSC07775.1 helix-turn-helix domain-containing protein [Streptomyces scopuliridis]
MNPRKHPRKKNASAMKMLGAQVATFRRAAGYTQRSLGERVVADEETIASIEQGRRPLKADLAETLDELLDTKGALSVGVANMPEIDQFPLWAEQYVDHEREAISLSSYENQVVPGLLQTEPYARAVFSTRVPAFDEDEIETKTAARIERQEIMHRKVPPTLSFVVWEPVLKSPLGGRKVYIDQLVHLRKCAELPGLTLQFLALDRAAHAGISGPFYLMETPDHQHLAYAESQQGSHWVSDPDKVSIMARKYAMLRSQALTPEESRDLLDELLGEQ